MKGMKTKKQYLLWLILIGDLTAFLDKSVSDCFNSPITSVWL